MVAARDGAAAQEAADELRADVKVTSVCPGFVQTDLTPMNKDSAPLTAEQAVDPIVAAASLSADAASGTFVDREGSVAW